MKNLINFKSADFNIGRNLDRKIVDARVAIKFAMKGRLKIDEYDVGIRDLPKDIRQAANQATNTVIEELGIALDMAMEAPIWNWPGGARDIIDTGALKNSLSINKAGNGFTITYSQPYAAIVHYGGYIQPYGNESLEKFYMPARPWITAVLEGSSGIPAFDFAYAYERAFESVLGKYN